mgnify:CR=1 FL=1
MIFMTNPITTNPVEDTVTDMQSEHVDTLKREIQANEIIINNLKSDSAILAHILNQVIEQQDIEANDLKDILSGMTHDRSKVIDTMLYWDVVDEHWFQREYEVTISIPVSLTLSIEAINEDDAEERALSQLDCERLEAFDLDYSVYYDAEIMEVREV